MENKFKVGDRVRVVSDVNGKYSTDSECWEGNEYTIINRGSNGGIWYQFSDRSSWAWQEELELVVSKQETVESTYTNQIAQDLAKIK